jgi:hypothetical protein
MQKIKFNDVTSQWEEIESRTLPKLIDFLRTGPYLWGSNSEIPTAIHYAIPLHKTSMFFRYEQRIRNAEECSNSILSLPMHPYLSAYEIQFISSSIRKFFKKEK